MNNYTNITNKWLGKNNKENIIKIYKNGDIFTFRGKKYVIDGKNVLYDIKKGELEFAKWLTSITDKKITILPIINKPDGIKSPDYRISNEYWDLKTIYGNSKNVVYHKIRHNKNQSENYIFDISNSKLEISNIIDQVKKIYNSNNPDRNWLNKVMIKKNKKYIIIKKAEAPA